MRLISALIVAALLAGPAAADPGSDARAVATRLVDDTYAAMTAPGLDAPARMAQLRTAISAAFAFDIWEKFLIGEQSAKFTPEQLAEFRDLLPGFIANLYATQFGKGLEAKPVIEDTRPARSDTLVRAGIPRANGKILPVDWRVRDFGARGPLVIDVMVGGTSFLILKRDEFGALLTSGGPTALLDYMRTQAN